MACLLSYVDPAADRGEAVGEHSALLGFLVLLAGLIGLVLLVLLLHENTSLQGTAYGFILPETEYFILFFKERGFLFARQDI